MRSSLLGPIFRETSDRIKLGQIKPELARSNPGVMKARDHPTHTHAHAHAQAHVHAHARAHVNIHAHTHGGREREGERDTFLF